GRVRGRHRCSVGLPAGIARSLAYGPDTGEVAPARGGRELSLRPRRKGDGHLAVERDRRLDLDAAGERDHLDGMVDAAGTALVEIGRASCRERVLVKGR